MQGKISGIQGAEPVENPNNLKRTIIGNDTRNRYQGLKKRKNRHEDPEIQKLIDKGWEVTSYKKDMPT